MDFRPYILTYNPQSWNLVHLCSHFPRFLAETHQKSPTDDDYAIEQGLSGFHHVFFSPNTWVLYQKNDQLKKVLKSGTGL